MKVFTSDSNVVQSSVPAHSEPLLFPNIEREPFNVLLKSLNPEEKSVMAYYFGLGFETATSLWEIGKKFGMTLDKVKHIKRTALEKLLFNCDNWFSAA